MAIEVTTPATELPVKRQEVKDHLKIDFTDDDKLIDEIIRAAIDYVEQKTFRKLVSQTVAEYLDTFPANEIILCSPDVVSITTVQYINSSDATITLVNGTDYEANLKTVPAKIRPVVGGTWPSTKDAYNSVIITYVAGYGDGASTPKGIKQSLLLICAHYYENRDLVGIRGSQIKFPEQVDFLLTKYQIKDFR